MQQNNSISWDLGELLGNPKGTKSFSSWSEFTDFVNEMPIKTIQPFVSNFNAFAGEGFYGNVVQGLVIKQLEDAVFIFGIAIDGTLIFRKRNYPDVSTWEDPKIIIHSNNWHKIYFVTDLGGLLPLASITSKGLISGLIVFNAYISSTTTCVLIEGSFNESGGMGVVNLDFRPYGMASYSISLFIDSVVRASVINGTNKNSFSIYYLTEGGLIRIKIIFIYDGPISMVARGNNTVIKSISKSENLDTNGFNKVTIS